MPDIIKSNLEPIDDGDLNLKNKFLGGTPEKGSGENLNVEKPAVETPSAPEAETERKEGGAEKEASYAKILSKIPQISVSQTANVTGDAKEASEMQDYESKLEKLVNIAETKGVVHAVKVARHMEDNYLLDELHDKLLASDFHDALIRKGLIREV